MHFLFEIIAQRTTTQKGSCGAQLTLLNLVSSVTPFSLLKKLSEKEILWRKEFPNPAYVKLMNYVQLILADASCDPKNKWNRRKINKGERK